MLHATEILGAQTFDSAGNFVGRVKEMFIEPADQPNRVARLLLGRGILITANLLVLGGIVAAAAIDRGKLGFEPRADWIDACRCRSAPRHMARALG